MSLEREGNDMFDLEPEEVGIDIYDMNNNLLEYEYDLKKTVENLINDIKADQGINEPDLLLFFNNELLDKNKTLKECGVVSLSKLYLKKKDLTLDNITPTNSIELSKMSLSLKTKTNEIIPIRVNPDGLCQEIVDEYMKIENFDSSKILNMSCNGKHLKPDQKISYYKLKNNDVIVIYVQLRGGKKYQ